jgi:hypothetical protein
VQVQKGSLGLDPAECDLILTDNAAFATAVNDYKHICSHILATIMELRYEHLMKPVYGMTHANLTYEFPKMQGVIHYHSLVFTEGLANHSISTIMQRAQIAVKSAGDLMNSQLHKYYLSHPSLDNDLLFPADPSTIFSHTGRQYREDFVKHAKDPRLTKAWEDCLQAIETALQQCAVDLQPIMEGEYGLCAMHTGNAPNNWVKPGSNPAAEHNY